MRKCCIRLIYAVLPVFAVLAFINSASAGMLAPSVSAVSSESPAGLDRDADHSVDGSGLTGSDKKHMQGETGVAWTTTGSYGAADYDPYITYDLGAVRDVSMMRIWNYNSAFVIKPPAPAANNSSKSSQELRTSRKRANCPTMSEIGADLVEVFTSADGINFASQGTVNFAQAPGVDDYVGQDIPVNYTGIRYIKFDIKTNHDGATFDGTGKKRGNLDSRALTGLSEVRFEVPDIVELRVSDDTTVVHEGGAGDSYDVRLVQQPASGENVQVKAVPSDPQIILNRAPAGIAVDVERTGMNGRELLSVPKMIVSRTRVTLHRFVTSSIAIRKLLLTIPRRRICLSASLKMTRQLPSLMRSSNPWIPIDAWNGFEMRSSTGLSIGTYRV